MADRLTYQEMLRTLGALLDADGCALAVVRMSRQEAEITAPGWRGAQRWTAETLQAAAGRQRAARGLHRPPGQGPRRWGPILRVLGAHLDTLSGSRYVLTLRPAAVLVQGGDYAQTFERTALERRARLLPYLRGR